MKPRIIWLCSWYPNEVDRFTGDFIQRHAMAASMYADITVLHVVHGHDSVRKEVKMVNPQLRETIVYTKAQSKAARYWALYRATNRFLSEYERTQGKPDVLHVHIVFPMGLVGKRWAKQWQIPLVITEHYGIYNEAVADAFSKRNVFFKWASRSAVQAAQMVLPVSEALARGMEQYLGKFPYTPVPNVVDTKLFHFAGPKLKKPFRFVHVSNMAEVKNVGGLIRGFAIAFKQAGDMELHLVGAQPEKYVALAREEGLLNRAVFFYPECSYAEVAEKIRSAHAGVLFSYSEMLPCVVLEYLCSGLPVVSSRVGGIPEVINTENGLLVESGHEAVLAEALIRMKENYITYHPDLISKEAAAQFSYEAVGKQLLGIYKEVTSKA